MANFDGGKYNSGQLEMRNLVLTVKIYPEIETNRINLYKYFPSKKIVRIYYQNETRDVYIDGMVETVEIDPTVNYFKPAGFGNPPSAQYEYIDHISGPTSLPRD